MISSERLNRIRDMEMTLNDAETLLADAQEFLQRWQALQPKIKRLAVYYHSSQWLEDYEASQRGEIPREIPHGVLSEDLIYNILGTQHHTAIAYLQWIAQVLSMDTAES